MNKELDFLNKLSEDFSADIVRELLVIFEKQFADALPNFAKYLVEKDLKSARQLAHSLKSSAGNIGAFDIALIFTNIEKDADRSLNQENLNLLETNYIVFKKKISSWPER